jgi:2-keto-4-pentenoate hydratase/2-oxohepta-3-ene-1,7-dioic acid hydratase in catechol pathway
MKIVRYRGASGVAWGMVDGDTVRPLADFVFDRAVQPSGEGELLAEVTLLAPIAPPRNVFCLGRNYAEHAKEGPGADQPLPSAPIWFTKATTAIADPESDIVVSRALTRQLDWEVELGVVIGRGGKHIPEERALEHVFGYTVLNDLSARDLQYARGQWFYSKSLDHLLPAGPCLVTADEIADPQTLELLLRVNGEERQHGATRDMIFSVAAAIADLSRGITLLPGDVIATGTPAGVGMGRKPPVWLEHGDVVEAEIPAIGILRNRIVFVD